MNFLKDLMIRTKINVLVCNIIGSQSAMEWNWPLNYLRDKLAKQITQLGSYDYSKFYSTIIFSHFLDK